MAKNKNKKSQLSSEGKAELAKTIGQKTKQIKKSYASVENTFAKTLRYLSTSFDKIVMNRKYSKFVALAVALMLYGIVNLDGSANSFFSTNQSTLKIENVAVNVLVNDSLYEVQGVPETVTVRLNGDLTDIQQAKLQGQYQVVLNLEGLNEGVHDVNFTVINISDRIEAVVEPTSVSVKIAKKTSRTFKVDYEYVNLDKKDSKYSLGVPELSQYDVTIRASNDTLDKIAFVKVLIDATGVTEDFEQDAKIIAFDKNGVKIDVNIVPQTVKAKVEVTTPKKTVPIVIEPIGVLPNDMSIKNYVMDHEAIEIYGNMEDLDKINEIVIKVPMYNIDQNRVITMPINLPQGVNSSNISKVNIDFKLEATQELELAEVPISYINNASGLKIALLDGEKSDVKVKLLGATNQIESIKADDLVVQIDLKDIKEAGTYEIDLVVSGPNPLVRYETEKKTIKIVVEKE